MIEGYQFITNIEKEDKVENTLYSTQWSHNIPKATEANIILDLIAMVKEKGRNITYDRMIVITDNNKIYKMTHSMKTANQYV